MTERAVNITIIIPVHNAERYLGECLDSCLSQSMDAIEIVCADDASSDNSSLVLADYAARDGRIRVISFSQNRGTFEARRAAVEVAKGKYTLFVDADDRLRPHACERLWDQSCDRDFVLFALEAFSDGNEELRRQAVRFNARRISDSERELVAEECLVDMLVRERAPMGLGGKLLLTQMIRSGYARLPRGYCVCGEDALVVLASFVNGVKGFCIPDRLYDYRIGSGISTSEGWSYARRLSWIRSGMFCGQALASSGMSFPTEAIRVGAWRCLVERARAAARWDANWMTRVRLGIAERRMKWTSTV